MRASDPARLTTSFGGASPRASELLDDPLLAVVGNTPLVPLRRLVARHGGAFELWGKLEATNPSGSVKDRAALAIVRAAIEAGDLGAGRTLVDASSGNTAVAYAMLGARLGFSVTLFVPRNASAERLARLSALGTSVVLTDPGAGTDGAQEEARALAASAPERYFFADQYNNPQNPLAHYRTTGPEIWRQSRRRLTHLVCGVGTGGTITGTARFLKEQEASIQVVGVEPDEPMHALEGLKHLPTARRPSTYDEALVDRTERVATEEAVALRAALARDEGLVVGLSSAAALVASLRVGGRSEGAYVVTVLPDSGGSPGQEPTA